MADYVAITNDDSIVYKIAFRLKYRADIGLKKYGVNMDRKDLTQKEWIDHAIEEALDLALYLEKLKEQL